MSPRQSAQSPTADPQPTKEDSYLDPENPVSKNPPEEACSDTPLTSDPYDNNGGDGDGDGDGGSGGSGGDYLTCRKVPAPAPAPTSSLVQTQGQRHWGPGSNSPRPASPAFFIPHSVLDGKKSSAGSGSSSGHGHRHISPSHSPGSAPGLPERGVRVGTGGVQYSGRQLQRKGSSHPLRQALGVDQGHEEDDKKEEEEEEEECSGMGEKESEQEQDQVKMAPPSEGKVARSVEGTREKAKEEQAHAHGGHVATQERGVKYKDLGLGEEHGHGHGPSSGHSLGHGEGQEYGETDRREGGQRRKSSAGQRHGRIRGEVSLDEDEAELERRKAQQSWDRE